MMIKRQRPLCGRRGDLQNMMNVTLMMIILAFFIVLNTLAVPAASKKKAALGSLTGTLGILSGGLTPMKSAGKEVAMRPEVLTGVKMKTAMLLGKFETYAVEEQVAEKMKTIVTKGGMEITIQSDILFEPGSARLTPKAERMIVEAALILKQIKGDVRVEGHTSDMTPGEPRYAGLVELSIARAAAVTRALVEKGGLDKNRLSVAGYGPMRPIKPGGTDEGRRQNDRVRLVYERAV